jgi:ankyrin repeat protein
MAITIFHTLCHASSWSHISRLANGADAAVQDADGETALHKAAAQGHVEVTRLLLQACPEATQIADRRNKTPREYASGDVCQVFDA